MSSQRPASGGRGRVLGALGRVPASSGPMRLLALIVLVMGVALVALGVTRARRVAEFAPVSVVESREPLQELPVRTAGGDEAVEPAHTYDAMIDLANIDAIVVGVDLDYLPKGLARYDAVIRDSEGTRMFRKQVEDNHFAEGRVMLRLFAKRFSAGDYTLDIEGFDEGATEGRVIASSWFQVSR